MFSNVIKGFNFLFSYRGVANRRQFFIGALIISITYIGMSILSVQLGYSENIDKYINTAYLLTLFGLITRRARDIEAGGWVLFIAIAPAAAYISYLCIQGFRGINTLQDWSKLYMFILPIAFVFLACSLLFLPSQTDR